MATQVAMNNSVNVSSLQADLPGGDVPISDQELAMFNQILNRDINREVDIDKLQSDPNSPLHSADTFESLKLKPELIQACYANNFKLPSKIQSFCIPLLIRTPSVDMVAQSQNGTGKTATFLLAILQNIDITINATQAIVIAPTMELAKQIYDVAQSFSRFMPQITMLCATKGTMIAPGTIYQQHLIIGTTGSICNFVEKFRVVDLANLQCVVLDEADHILAVPGLQDVTCRILGFIKSMKPQVQLLFFSATFDDPKVEHLIQQFAPEAQRITTRRKDNILHRIKQYVVKCETRDDKFQALIKIFASVPLTSSIIFTYTRKSAQWIAEKMAETGRKVALLHGELPKEIRAENVARFANSEYKILVTTNVASRGLDIPQVALVINYDPPFLSNVSAPTSPDHLGYADYDTYLHRVGRTGRFGKPGLVINLVDNEISDKLFKEIAEYFECPMQVLDPNNYTDLDKLGS